MPSPAPRFAEDETVVREHGWPEPQRRRPPVRPTPPPRRRRSPQDGSWLVLGALGLALGAAAAIWYLSLNRSSPPARLEVPRVVGKPEAVAVRQLTTKGFSVRAIEKPGNAAAGIVFSQRPAPASTIARGATVTIRVANGQKP